MSAQSIAASPRPAGQARDLQAQLYRDIGISAVAAALRFTTQPEPPARAGRRAVGHAAGRPQRPRGLTVARARASAVRRPARCR